MSMAKPVRVPVSLTEDQHKALTKEAERLGLTISAFMRMAALERMNAGKD